MAAAALQIASKAVKKTEGHVKEHKYCGCLFMKHSNLSEHKHHKHAVKMKKLKQKQEALLSQVTLPAKLTHARIVIRHVLTSVVVPSFT